MEPAPEDRGPEPVVRWVIAQDMTHPVPRTRAPVGDPASVEALAKALAVEAALTAVAALDATPDEVWIVDVR